MTPKEYYEWLTQAKPGVVPVPPLLIKIGQEDVMAARLLLWLYAQMPDSTQGEIDDTLDAAKWWSVLFASAHMAKTQVQP